MSEMQLISGIRPSYARSRTGTVNSRLIGNGITLFWRKDRVTGRKSYWTDVNGTAVSEDWPHDSATSAIEYAKREQPKITEKLAEIQAQADKETAEARAEIAALEVQANLHEEHTIEAEALVANAPEEDHAPVFELPEAV